MILTFRQAITLSQFYAIVTTMTESVDMMRHQKLGDDNNGNSLWTISHPSEAYSTFFRPI